MFWRGNFLSSDCKDFYPQSSTHCLTSSLPWAPCQLEGYTDKQNTPPKYFARECIKENILPGPNTPATMLLYSNLASSLIIHPAQSPSETE